MKRWVFAMLAVGVGSLALYECSCEILWGGRFDLSITVTDPPESLRWVFCGGFMDRRSADRYLDARRDDDADGLVGSMREESCVFDRPFRGDPLRMRVAIDGRDSCWLGRRSAVWQDVNWLVVIAERADGTRVVRVVDIRDAHKTKRVRITMR